MRKYILALSLTLFVALPALAGFAGIRTYYSDAAMTNATGSERLFCNNTTSWLGGTTSTYRRFEGLHCESANDVVICHQWTGSSWVAIACPY